MALLRTTGCEPAAECKPRLLDEERPRVLIVAREMTRGGAAYLALRHTRELSQHYRVDVLVTGLYDDEFLGEFPRSVTIFRLNGLKLAAEGSTAEILKAFSFANDHQEPYQVRYQTVLATSVFPDPIACAVLCTIRAEQRIVFLVDESLALCAGYPPIERAIVEECVRAANLVLPVSSRLWQQMGDQFPGLRQRPWRSLRPPVDTAKIIQQAQEPQETLRSGLIPNVLTISRLSRDKRILQCVQIHHHLKQLGFIFRWYVVGVGAEEARIREEIQALGMEDDFFLLGRRDDVYALLQACDIFALFSQGEGCPTVVIEALTLGRPVVMTDVNGSDELLENGTLGRVTGHEPAQIADGLARMVVDEGLRIWCQANIAASMARTGQGGPAATLVELIADPALDPVPPRVSILIPTYNQAPSIERAITSALDQDFASLEVVVLDDASTDATGTIARRWEFDRRVRYVRNRRNLGRVANYRQGLLDQARGEWVLMLDGDDYLADRTFIRETLEAIGRAGSRPIVFAQAGHRVHYSDNRRADVDILPPIASSEQVVHGAEYLRLLFESGFFSHLGSLYHREAAIRARFYTAEISSSDMESLMRLALEGDVLLVNRIAGYWVQHGSNASSHLPLNRLEANVRIFRKAAREAIRRGLIAPDRIETPLLRYEVRSLIVLFDFMIENAIQGPREVAQFAAIAYRINPQLFRDAQFLDACHRYLRTLVQPRLDRSRAGRFALRTARVARAGYRRLGGKSKVQPLAR